ncbi:MAG TPA: hypothetical protein VHA52_10065 [Candidatus Babeliaceae bacterium]|nr:hypothetical protein [Candidatus Babeliaceae bacterium]
MNFEDERVNKEIAEIEKDIDTLDLAFENAFRGFFLFERLEPYNDNILKPTLRKILKGCLVLKSKYLEQIIFSFVLHLLNKMFSSVPCNTDLRLHMFFHSWEEWSLEEKQDFIEDIKYEGDRYLPPEANSVVHTCAEFLKGFCELSGEEDIVVKYDIG